MLVAGQIDWFPSAASGLCEFAKRLHAGIGTCVPRFGQECVSRAHRIELLEQGVNDYTQLIRTFEADRALMLARPTPSDPSRAVMLAEALKANARALELLAQALANIKARLEQERSTGDTGGAP